MKTFAKLNKLKAGDTVGIVSPSFAAPAVWPHMYELGLKRVREVFNLNHTDYPATAKLGATAAERTADLITAFTDPNVKAVIASLGGDDQITYIKNPPHRALHTKPKTICKILHLTKPQYAQLSQWGHFGHGNIWDKPF